MYYYFVSVVVLRLAQIGEKAFYVKRIVFPDEKKRPKKLFFYLRKTFFLHKILERIAGNSFTKIRIIEVLKKYFNVFIGLFNYKFYFC
jgi:hypothetical protein